MSTSPSNAAAAPTLPDGFKPRMLSFDVYGTLVNTPPASLAAFRSILDDVRRPDLDAWTVYSYWESRNIGQYTAPYKSYKEICRQSLSETYEKFCIINGRDEAIHRYFDIFPSMELYPDALPTLNALARDHRLALVSNIDDDLLHATKLGREFDLVCTAERARGYKPDGTLFRYLLEQSGLPVLQILHSGQSQFTDMVGGKPLGLTIAWINRRDLTLDPSVPPPDLTIPGLEPLLNLLGA